MLLEKDVNLVNILTSKNPAIFEDNINITVGITALQLGLVDLLNALKLKPANMLGYSIGEIACAYADNALTIEQAILCSYYIGLASGSDKELVSNLRKVIGAPRKRSSAWVTTLDNEDMAQTCSAEYLVLSMSCATALNRTIPKDAVVLEVAPCGHFQAFLKRASADVSVMSLLKKGGGDNVKEFLTSIGELYLCGVNPRSEFIYPEVQFPVSRGTPMLAPLIKWDHSLDWYVTKFETQEKIKSGERTVTVLLSDEEMEYVAGHVIDGMNKFHA